MRRALIALLGAVATTFALIGSKYFVTASAGAGHLTAEPPAHRGTPTGDGSSTPDIQNSGSASPSASGSATPTPMPSPRMPPVRTSTPAFVNRPAVDNGNGNRSNVGSSDGGSSSNGGSSSGGSSSPPSSSPPSCVPVDGDDAKIGPVGGSATVYVTVTICGGVATEFAGGIMMSNYEPTNSTAIAELNKLALKYYKTDVSLISYTGATATSAAYQTSMKSALTRAGI